MNRDNYTPTLLDLGLLFASLLTGVGKVLTQGKEGKVSLGALIDILGV